MNASWQITQSVDGSTGTVSWRVFRYIVSDREESKVRTREYARTKETDTDAILEFSTRNDAQAHCDTLNGYAYVADDSGDIKVRQRERVKMRDRSENNARQLRERALIRPRNEKMTPEALASLLADD